MQEDELVIRIPISGLVYKLRIPRKDEPVYRAAGKLLQQRLDFYEKKFDLPYPDILSMVAYEFAVEYSKLQTQYHAAPISVMDSLSEMIDNELNDEK